MQATDASPVPATKAMPALGDGNGVAASLCDLPADVLDLMAAQASRSLQVGPAWFENLERTVFPGHAGLRYMWRRRAGQAVVVLPLRVERRLGFTEAHGLANYYSCIFSPALAADANVDDLVNVLRALRHAYPGLRLLRLAPMDPAGRAFALLEQALAPAGFRGYRYFCFGNWWLQVPPDWKAYMASRSSTLRSTIKRMNARIDGEQGRLEILTEAAELDRGMRAYRQVYDSSWKVPEPSPMFMPGLAALCQAQGALRLGLVWLGDKPIAAQLWIVVGRRAEIYKVAYDEAYKRLSPGTVLTAHLMRHVIENDRVDEVDFLLGDDDYKRYWMSDRRERWGLMAYNLRSPAGLAGFALDKAQRALRRWWPRRTQ